MKDFEQLFDTVCHRAAVVLGDKAFHWLSSSVESLGGKTPFEVIKLEHEAGLEKVIQILGRIEHGIFS